MREMFPTAPLQSQETDDIDPGFLQPGFQADMDEIDPDFSVMPPFPSAPTTPSIPTTPSRPTVPPIIAPPGAPGLPVPPIIPPRPFPQRPNIPATPVFPPATSCPGCPVFPLPGAPCLFCSNNQLVSGSVRMLNGATGYNAFDVYIDNQPAFFGFEFAEVTSYRRLSQGYHTFSIMNADGGYVYLRKSLYINDGMATIAIINDAGGLNLTVISDSACPTSSSSSCFRAANLAYFSGPVNVSISNIIFNAVPVGQAASFSRVRNGGYNLTVARSARPGNTLINTNIFLNPNRIYTLYVLNWNQSADTIRTLLVEDRRN